MLNYNEIQSKKTIILDGEPYIVLSAQTVKKQRQKPTNQTKLKNLVTGSVVERTFHQSDKVDEADIEKREVKYLYSNKGESWFCNPNKPSDRFLIDAELISDSLPYMKENEVVEALVFDEKIIGVSIPIKVDLKVTEAPPAVRGDTAQGGTKQVVLETGATTITPLFINEGDVIRINTETGEYVERVGKK
ncbi:elongation factor P [Candidatus Kaiserbacteria bacterium CG10_big_fil_rev_8_21_14_0_10_49_17]|uniref:Elongation factor P n=1 Tax=Candidatus Kaiserbacteria bacterium CG10_big_fil_rev_8_21_14_0_10_49_17 TaxID=1974609 RepID=A0A2M6WDP4_9BACT|nr:MAG: elongation factor P [Candidatus Kaiserbacteria bacterium CG10_big_fil_rev_8_21_14_0_10_49_17]